MILGKCNASVGSDALLYTVPVGKTAAVSVRACNRAATASTIRVALISSLDLSVESLTLIDGGSGYTSVPTITFTGTNTTPATAVVTGMELDSIVLNAGGTGYAVGNTLTIVGGTGTSATIQVLTVNAGVVETFSILSSGDYTVLPTGTVATTGGAGTGATFKTLRFKVKTISLTSVGNGYTEAPTVTITGAATLELMMTQTVEDIDYIEYEKSLASNTSYEVSRLILSAGESVFVRGSSTSVGFLAIGFEQI